MKRTPKERRSKAPTMGKKSTQALPAIDIRFSQVAHWPSPINNKIRCKLCSMAYKMHCSKCKTLLLTG